MVLCLEVRVPSPAELFRKAMEREREGEKPGFLVVRGCKHVVNMSAMLTLPPGCLQLGMTMEREKERER